jgi:hypothetical protein
MYSVHWVSSHHRMWQSKAWLKIMVWGKSRNRNRHRQSIDTTAIRTSERNRSIGWSRNKWEDNIKTDIIETNWVRQFGSISDYIIDLSQAKLWKTSNLPCCIKSKKKKKWSYRCNRPWKPIGLRDV